MVKSANKILVVLFIGTVRLHFSSQPLGVGASRVEAGGRRRRRLRWGGNEGGWRGHLGTCVSVSVFDPPRAGGELENSAAFCQEICVILRRFGRAARQCSTEGEPSTVLSDFRQTWMI